MNIKGYEMTAEDKERMRKHYEKLMPLVNKCRLDGYEGRPAFNYFDIEEAMPAVVEWHRQGVLMRELGALEFLFNLDDSPRFYKDRYKTA